LTSSGGHLLSSRRRVLVATLGVLAVLDLGRSIYAHFGFDHPLERWQPDPQRYADIAWPPGADLPSNAPRGAVVYWQHCVVCHGPDGRGNGPAAPSLIPRPRDFTSGQFKYKSTPTAEPPSDADLLRVVSRGLDASAMPFFHDLLPDADLREVVNYIKHFSTVFDGAAPHSMAMPPRIAASTDSIARGGMLFNSRGCQACHGEDGRGGAILNDAKGYPVLARDLTAPWTFRGGSEPEQIWLRLSTGVGAGVMPSFAGNTTDNERWDLVNYVLSIARIAPWEAGGKLAGPGQQPDLARRGAYLVHAEMCGLCHTIIDRTGIYRGDDYYLAGGMRVEVYPHGVIVSRNLTSDNETGLGSWSERQIVDALRNGRSGGRVLNMFDMPWIYLHSLSNDDATAMARYLKTLPAVHNHIPAELRFGVIETIIGKIGRPLPAIRPTRLTFADQQFGQKEGRSREWPQTWLIDSQWVVLVVGVIAFALAALRRRRAKHSWVRIAACTAGLILVVMLGYAYYQLPLLLVIPPDQIVAGATAGIPEPKEALLKTFEQTTLVKRGRYLFTVASCALCHGNDGRGGFKVSWKPMGTLWARNITSDPDTGLGKWTDLEIARAIRSGVSRDGYQLHWQGMTWDHASNWDEEDIRGLIAYLRATPPVNNKVPADRAPAADDCDVYTFWISESHVAGCR
jgi:mono/diheme cytochrome c family protein